MIYFVQAIEGGPVKIGYSADVDARVRQLEQTYGCALAVLAVMPGEREDEREIHERFAHLRFGRTEQFRPTSELMKFIGRPLLVSANPETTEAMPNTSKPVAFQVRGTDAYKAAVEAFAEAEGKSVAALADHAIRAYARQVNYAGAIPKR